MLASVRAAALSRVVTSAVLPSAAVAAAGSAVNAPVRSFSVLGQRRQSASSSEERRRLAGTEKIYRLMLEQGTSFLRMGNTARARDIFCKIVSELETSRAMTVLGAAPKSVADARLLAAGYAGRARSFCPPTSASYEQVLRDFDAAMRLDPAWKAQLTRERKLCEASQGANGIPQMLGLQFLPVRL